MDNYLFYDIEIFLYNAIVVFKDHEKRLLRIFHNDFTELASFIEGKTLVGFNNYYYDDKLLGHMLQLRSPQQLKILSDRLIKGESIFTYKDTFESLDTYQQIDVSRPSLKKIEGNMGRKILESSVPFSIDRPLEPDEYKQTIEYCSYDVDTTIEIFHKRLKSYFRPKFSMVEMLGRPKAIKWNTTTISANLLLDQSLGKWFDLRVEEHLLDYVPEDVKKMWLQKANLLRNQEAINQDEKPLKHVTVNEFDCTIQFAFGGLHGAHNRIKKERNVVLLDALSMYPNIIILLNVLGKATDKYKALLEQRIRVKHTDKVLSDALKLILNSVFGNLNSEYSLLHNPNALLTVCAYGQIALYELCKRLHPYVTIININTDGIIFTPNSDTYIPVYKHWEKEFKLQLEQKTYDLFFQKDVNNYIAVKGDDITCKGGDVNRYAENAFFKNNNARILDICLVEALVYDRDIWDTLREYTDRPEYFQYILKAGNSYKGTVSNTGEHYNKVNRIFAAKEGDFCLYKQRMDGMVTRFADTPSKMFLWNEDCKDLQNFEKMIDLSHYHAIIEKRLERWNTYVY